MKIRHSIASEWLEELQLELQSMVPGDDSSIQVRITKVYESADSNSRNVYVVAGFFGSDRNLVELVSKMDSLDWSLCEPEGSAEAAVAIADMRKSIDRISEESGKLINIRGGQFQVL